MKMKALIWIFVTLSLVIYFYLFQLEKIPDYGKEYIENYGWHVDKIVTNREKINDPVNDDFLKEIMNLTGINVNKEQYVYQERFRLKEKCNKVKMDAVIFTNEREKVMGGYLIKTNSDPGTMKIQSYNTFINNFCKKN